MKKRKNKKSNAKLKTERLQKFGKQFENEFNPIFEKSEIYGDKKIIDDKSAYDFVTESGAEMFIKWFKYLDHHGVLQECPQFFDEYIKHLAGKFGIVGACHFAHIMAVGLNIIEGKEVHKGSDFYQINYNNLTKKLKEKVKRIDKRLGEEVIGI